MPRVAEGSKFRTDITALSSTNDTDCYVVPKNFAAHIENVFIANNDGSNRTFTVKYFNKKANTTTTLFDAHASNTKTITHLVTMDKPLYIHSEDKIIVAASAADTLLVGVAAEEFYDPNR
tara:strand:- start:1772 stop:2131 length:360 start_codon:yes stop_codon:yes gene_type:complete